MIASRLTRQYIKKKTSHTRYVHRRQADISSHQGSQYEMADHVKKNLRLSKDSRRARRRAAAACAASNECFYSPVFVPDGAGAREGWSSSSGVWGEGTVPGALTSSSRSSSARAAVRRVQK